METMNNEINNEIPMKRGRPKTIKLSNEEYHKQYYEKNKEKYIKKGQYFCSKCDVYCSMSNKSKHNKLYHDVEKEELKKDSLRLKEILNKLNELNLIL